MVVATPLQNHLLAALSDADARAIERWLEPVTLTRGEVLARPGQAITHAYFPISGMISVVVMLSHGLGAEVATVGNEGMMGPPILLRADSAPFHIMTQLSGEAVRVPARQLAAALTDGSSLANLLQAYAHAFFVQIAQNAACNGIHPISQRSARWLLATQDRAQSDRFHLTQDFLAFMLGVARQSVGLAVAALQRQGLIEYRRGDVHILDRSGLEAASCECYEIVRVEFSRLLGIARA